MHEQIFIPTEIYKTARLQTYKLKLHFNWTLYVSSPNNIWSTNYNIRRTHDKGHFWWYATVRQNTIKVRKFIAWLNQPPYAISKPCRELISYQPSIDTW